MELFGSSVYAWPFDRMPVEQHTCKHPGGCSKLATLSQLVISLSWLCLLQHTSAHVWALRGKKL